MKESIMKKILTLIIALVAMVSGAWADKTPIYTIEATAEPDPAAIAMLGVSVKTKPKMTVTKGAPSSATLMEQREKFW